MKKQLVLLVLLLGSSAAAYAQGSTGQKLWEEFGERIGSSRKISPLGPDLFGEGVSLSNGALSFSATDVALPGNSALPVALERQYTVSNRRWHLSSYGMLADWDFNLPSIGAVFNPNWVVNINVAQPPTSARCTVRGAPPVGNPVHPSDFWHGVRLTLPGQDAGEVLVAPTPVTLQDGRSYSWVSGNGQIRLACLPTIKNGTGEGFIAVTPDGTKYWFDWMAQTHEPPLTHTSYFPNGPGDTYGLALKKNTLYATRVEDRFGNYVEYTYTNAWNAPGKLTKISANDGRVITLNYSGAYVSSISDGTRSWSYTYNSTPSGRTTLNQVTLPDTSSWLINFLAFTNDGEIRYLDYVPLGEIIRTCTLNEAPQNISNTFTGTMTHPSGAVGAFVVDIREHGRSNVPISCRHVTTSPNQTGEPENNPNDDINMWATKAYSFTLKQKRIGGPGLVTAEWNYSYVPGTTIYRYPGTTVKYPVCDWLNYDCSLPSCQSDSCAGSSKTTVTGPNGQWTRYTYGNSYRYNEGKLLKVETGTSEQDILKTTIQQYDLTLQNQAYPARFGESQSTDGDGFQNEYHRPLTKTETDQQNIRFKYQVNEFDNLARPKDVTRSSMPVSP